MVKSARWLLLRNRAKLSEKQDVKLQELLAADQPLAMVYVLKEALKGIWYAPSVWEGWRRWRSWMRQVKESGLAPLQRFGREFIEKYMRGSWRVQTTRCTRGCAGRGEQQDQSDKAHGIWFRDSGILFTENPRQPFPESRDEPN